MVGGGTAIAEPPPREAPVLARRGWQVDLTGWLQADLVPWSEDSFDELDPGTGEPLNQERFLIRRGRARVDARSDGMFAVFELDGNTLDGATARVLAAQVGYTLPAPGAASTAPALATITAGLFRTPFGFEVPMAERDKPFVEPPAYARALIPGNYDAGVMVNGAYGVARWAFAMVNGTPVGDAQWRGRDPISSFDFVGRVGAVVEGPYRFRVEAGVSAIAGRGLHAGAPPTKDELQWVDENNDGIVQTTELRVVPGAPGTPSQTFERDAIGADVQLHWCLCVVGTGTAFAEAVLATNLDRGLVYSDPIAATRDLRQLGFAVGIVQNLGAHAQVGARYDRYNADRDALEQQGIELAGIDQVFSTVSLMASGRHRAARFVVQYDHERNPFGRADNGMPVTRETDRLTLRAQVGF